MQNPISYTQGSEQNPLNIHFWQDADGIRVQEFRQGLKGGDLSKFSAVQGEDLGHRYIEDNRGYQPVLVDDQKGISQGHDGVYFDQTNQELVVVEFKGQGAVESQLQKQPAWSLNVCEDIKSGRAPYQNASIQEKKVAEVILSNYAKGNRIRYEVVRTKVEGGKLISQLEKRTYLEMGMDTKTEGIRVQSIRNLTEEILNRSGWAKGNGVKTYEGRDYTLTKNGNVLMVEAKDGRGVLLKLEGRDLVENNLTKADMERFQAVEKSLQIGGQVKQIPSIGLDMK